MLQLVKELPDAFSIDKLIDRMIVLEKVQTDLTQSEAGEIMATEAAKTRLKKWL